MCFCIYIVLAKTDSMQEMLSTESKSEYFVSINCFQVQVSNFGSVQNFSVHIIEDFTSFLSVLASNKVLSSPDTKFSRTPCGLVEK